MWALTKGNRNKSVGMDGVSHKLLVEICRREEGRKGLLSWFNGILQGDPMPEEWSSVVMILLPKVGNARRAGGVAPNLPQLCSV